MPVILGANSASGGYDITNSARFNSGSSDRLTRTQTAGNRQIFTWSFWFKISELLDNVKLILAHNNTHPSTQATLDSQAFQFYQYNGSSLDFQLTTTQLFRDVSAWYHMVIAVDTTQATSSNRIKIYLNGSQITAFSTSNYPSQNFNTEVNDSGAIIQVSGGGTPSNPFGGYMTEIYNIDGQQLTPSSFGETDEDTGIWKPKAYTGTYGTNGFYLDFEDSANLGNDMSGNNNDFTVNNLTSIDQTTDTPTNNFATMNPNDKDINIPITFSEGNCSVSFSNSGGEGMTRSTFAVNKGKWYWEMKLTSVPVQGRIGVTTDIDSANNSPHSNGIAWQFNDATVRMKDVSQSGSWGSNPTTNDILMFALDCDNKAWYFGVNGTWRNSGSPTSGSSKTGAVDYSGQSSLADNYLMVAFGGNFYTAGGTQTGQYNFGNPIYSANSYADADGYGNFSYQVPSGYYSLNSKNLAQYG